jgi:hypothetical protein
MVGRGIHPTGWREFIVLVGLGRDKEAPRYWIVPAAGRPSWSFGVIGRGIQFLCARRRGVRGGLGGVLEGADERLDTKDDGPCGDDPGRARGARHAAPAVTWKRSE